MHTSRFSGHSLPALLTQISDDVLEQYRLTRASGSVYPQEGRCHTLRPVNKYGILRDLMEGALIRIGHLIKHQGLVNTCFGEAEALNKTSLVR
jgi:hypothetical protein